MCGVSLQAQRQSKSAREIGADAQAPDLFDPFCFVLLLPSAAELPMSHERSTSCTWATTREGSVGTNPEASSCSVEMFVTGGSQSSWWKTKTGMKTQCGKELEEVQERI